MEYALLHCEGCESPQVFSSGLEMSRCAWHLLRCELRRFGSPASERTDTASKEALVYMVAKGNLYERTGRLCVMLASGKAMYLARIDTVRAVNEKLRWMSAGLSGVSCLLGIVRLWRC